jgi:hypothetical protein
MLVGVRGVQPEFHGPAPSRLIVSRSHPHPQIPENTQFPNNNNNKNKNKNTSENSGVVRVAAHALSGDAALAEARRMAASREQRQAQLEQFREETRARARAAQLARPPREPSQGDLLHRAREDAALRGRARARAHAHAREAQAQMRRWAEEQAAVGVEEATRARAAALEAQERRRGAAVGAIRAQAEQEETLARRQEAQRAEERDIQRFTEAVSRERARHVPPHGLPYICSCRHDPRAPEDVPVRCARNCEFFGRYDAYLRAKHNLLASIV